jgi:hypothetical protein
MPLKADKEVQNRLRDEILNLGMRNVDIAAAVDCNAVTVDKWINGRAFPGAHFLRCLHELGCDITYIITGEAR